jgi:hypothetical protein
MKKLNSRCGEEEIWVFSFAIFLWHYHILHISLWGEPKVVLQNFPIFVDKIIGTLQMAFDYCV